VAHPVRSAARSLRALPRVHEALAGPKTLVTFAGVGHESILAARPEAWRAAVEALVTPLAR
jgi:hypothetical protein